MLRGLRKKLQRIEISANSVRIPLGNQLIAGQKSVSAFLTDLSSFCYVTFDARSLRLFDLFLIGKKCWKVLNLEFPFFSSKYHSATFLYPKYYNEVKSMNFIIARL